MSNRKRKINTRITKMMFKKIYSFLKKKTTNGSRVEKLTKLSETLYPNKNVTSINEEITHHKINGVVYSLGDKVIARSNECDPLIVGTIVEFWNNNGKWSNCIPQIKDDLNGVIWSHMGTIVLYTDELFKTLEPMKPLEQWNYLLPNSVKELYSYTNEQIIKKEKQYKRVQDFKTKNKDKHN